MSGAVQKLVAFVGGAAALGFPGTCLGFVETLCLESDVGCFAGNPGTARELGFKLAVP